MALLVWLPLNGNLNNLGLSNVVVSNNAATVNDDGKIGKCYSFGNNSTSYLSIPNVINSSTTEFSIACWVYVVQLSNGYSCIYCSRTATNGKGIAMWITSSAVRIDDGVMWSPSFSWQFNTWYHVCTTWTTSKKTLYINGELISSTTSTSPLNNLRLTLRIGNDELIANTYRLIGKLNDFRIYDHCLSPKEIKEISKGLVLHYKLDDDFSNLRSSMTSFTWNLQVTLTFYGNNSTITNSNNEFTVSAKTGTSFSVSNSTALNYLLSNNDHKFYMCAKIKSDSNITIRFGCIYYVGYSTGETRSTSGVLTNTYKKFSVITSGSYNGTTYGISCKDTSIDGLSFVFKDAMCIDLTVMYGEGKEPATVELFELDYYKLFEKQLNYESYNSGETVTLAKLPIYDSSGYGNNGIITGELSCSNNTERYDYSTLFNGTSFISISLTNPSILTMSAWIKTTKNKTTSLMICCDREALLCISIYNGTIIGYYGPSGSSGVGSKCTLGPSYKENDWNHIVVVKTGVGTRDTYCNGVKLVPTSNDYWSTSPSGAYIGSRNYSSSPLYFLGYISDVRFYTTILSEEDIKELYNTSAIVDNLGNTYGYLFNENGQTPNLLDLALRALTNKLWKDCLFNSSSLPKAVVTLTDDGLRVYREPNNTSTTSGSGEGKLSNWGGFVLTNTNNMFGLLDGHTYLIQVDVKGKSDRTLSDYGWRHHVGWNYTNTGIAPAPTNTVLLNPITSNFNTEEWLLLSYKFTISDSVYKVATTTYLYHTEGETYLAYYLFKFGWTYGTTGEIGTDVYFSNLRMFDITFIPKEININKLGILNAFQLSENENVAFIDYYCGSTSNQFIEI